MYDAYGFFGYGDIFVFDKVVEGRNRYTFKAENDDEGWRVWAYCEEEPTKFIEINQ